MTEYETLRRIVADLLGLVHDDAHGASQLTITIPHETFLRIISMREMRDSVIAQDIWSAIEPGSFEFYGIKFRSAAVRRDKAL